MSSLSVELVKGVATMSGGQFSHGSWSSRLVQLVLSQSLHNVNWPWTSFPGLLRSSAILQERNHGTVLGI